MTLRNHWLGVAPLLAVFAAASPSEARACGGTFCDGGGPQVMAVDQSGENVLFAMQDGVVEAHVQIQYQGDPAQFAWIVPMQAVPDVEVGSQPLFDAVLAATVPTFTLASRFDGEDCGDGGRGGFCGTKLDDASFAGGGDEGLGESGSEDPTVVVKGTAGAFEYAVLDGGTIDGIVAWLDDNGFARDDDAPAILAEYLDEGFVFVAFKLRPGTGVDEIHPVILRWQGDEPCVPIRLTRIAATEDMPIRAFFLGERRVVPTNYRHTRINPVRIDWQRVGANYLDVVTLAVDDEEARGRAFVAEFAGRSDVVDRTNVWSSRWDASRFMGLSADRLIDELMAQGLVDCDVADECVPLHPLVPALVDEFFAEQLDGPTQNAWRSWSAFFGADGLDPNDWPDAEFAARFEELLVAPGEHAVELLDGNPYLTRLFTTISPAEMIEDPLFHETDGLPEVSNQFSATMVSDCDGPTHIELADGRRIQLDDDGVAPTFDTMPAAEATEELPPLAGPPIVLADHREAIDDELDAWNAAHGDGDGCGCRVAKLRLDGMMLVVLLALGMRARGGRRFA